MTTILPPNVSDLEKNLDEAGASRLNEIKTPVATVWDANTCPIEALPYLAWALSVDYWRSDWPESIQRQVTADSPDYHRIKGSRPAVERAIKNLGFDAKCYEWFEMVPEGEPCTFRVDVFAKDRPITEDMALEIGHSINAAKRDTLHLLDVKINLRSDAKLHLAAFSKVGERLRILPRQQQTLTTQTQLNLAVGLRITETTRLTPRAA